MRSTQVVVALGGDHPPKKRPTRRPYATKRSSQRVVDYQEKGHKIELGGGTVAGKPVFHLKVTKKGGAAAGLLPRRRDGARDANLHGDRGSARQHRQERRGILGLP